MFDFLWSWWQGLKNLWAWLPLIWNDRDWDHGYLLRMMAFKLRRMQRQIDLEARHVGYERHVRQVQITAYLLERLTSSPYLMNEIDARGPEADWKPEFVRSVNSDTYLMVPNASNGFHQACDRSHVREKEEWQMFLRYFGKYCQSWWT